ncbi:hypothetical protein [Confluentibacter flavum]|uniref:Uncharacterized protein n=1 Tax=Confluentibacter flavum TaxID=1909700 RepID=A0A2N3HNA7_9FLAO|nr:hypothetical protein [Confluentibacter flavum]PKQ46411.1 hypothetical protein CSW08_04420 [Confluentibacter flavum]PKQ46663.1 hypothetical protein CSW08_01770 [Confluentibacter flavum]
MSVANPQKIIYPITVNPELKNGLRFYDIHSIFIKNGYDFGDKNIYIMTAQICFLIGFKNEHDAKNLSYTNS